MAEMMGLFEPGLSGEIDRETLLKYFNGFFTHLKTNLILWKMYMAIFSQPAVLLLLSKEIQEASVQPLGMMKRYFKKQGYKKPAIEVAFLSTLISGVTYEYIADPENYPLDQIRKRILSFY
jgi:hypothetical protein